ncbi:hypothetical protein PR003_g17320 [Phytophthora rubi]|uniref:Secreted protein n=1 Tax=Phytophthora rubi TaxID=129364 RepID=A0A6A3GE58_9STRA|nr:hypothetical protein PR002_g31879 [Phytophthora rubi]KAE8997845.1 hypothetical protein PR001_g19475 [Phytophthora rubi]KAE9322061.1 hypothetical protein PR003_g17320 [Phytophthora rubi]
MGIYHLMFCICVISGFLRTGLLWRPGPPPNGSCNDGPRSKSINDLETRNDATYPSIWQMARSAQCVMLVLYGRVKMR